MSEEEKKQNQALFFQLLLIFQTAAMQQMGKLVNPLTKEVEKDLNQAKFSIDVLGMIQGKTKGNLTEEEKKFLEHVIFELRMNYLDEVKKADRKKEEEKTESAEKKESQEGKGDKEN